MSHTDAALLCVGCRCSVLQQKKDEEMEQMWGNVDKAAEDATVGLKEAIKALQEDANYFQLTQPTQTKRKFTLKKILGQLTKASAQITAFKNNIDEIRERSSTFQRRSSTKEFQEHNGHTTRKMDMISLELQKAKARLQEEEHIKSKIAVDLEKAKKSAEKAFEQLRSNEAQQEGYAMEVSRLKANEERLREENEMLKKEKETNAMAIEQVERYKELKQGEEALRDALEQQEALKKQYSWISGKVIGFSKHQLSWRML